MFQSPPPPNIYKWTSAGFGFVWRGEHHPSGVRHRPPPGPVRWPWSAEDSPTDQQLYWQAGANSCVGKDLLGPAMIRELQVAYQGQAAPWQSVVLPGEYPQNHRASCGALASPTRRKNVFQGHQKMTKNLRKSGAKCGSFLHRFFPLLQSENRQGQTTQKAHLITPSDAHQLLIFKYFLILFRFKHFRNPFPYPDLSWWG